MTELKIKPLNNKEILISIDRLTRFKNPEDKYLRVFKEIILNNLISPKYKKSELEKKSYEEIKNLAQEILNQSLKLISQKEPDLNINKKLTKYENETFIVDENTSHLINNEINYNACIDLINENCVQNLRWLKALKDDVHQENIRENLSLKFPIEKVLIVEGATEETLLPEFSKLCKYDFDKKGIQIISAGGKNQVVKLYYELAEILRIPIFVLLDKDAAKNCAEINAKLRSQDKIHLLECGEFEDLLPENLITRTLNDELGNISDLKTNLPAQNDLSRVKYLEEIFKHRGLHEFKKVEFAKMVKRNIMNKQDISEEIQQIIQEIKREY